MTDGPTQQAQTDEAGNRLTAMMRLSLVGELGPINIRRLLERFGSAEAVLAARRGELMSVEGIGPKAARAVLNAPSEDEAAAELARTEAVGAHVLTSFHPQYPEVLKTIYDPPVMLYVKGELLERDALAVAVVGTRRASFYALKQARSLASALAGMGFTIVSGMARGIDSAAHEGALDAGGRTIAVWGSGLATVYPEENAELALRIVENGAVLTEFPVNYPILAQNFPRRNRIVSGLSMGVIVVEGTERSGAMITARLAAEQGREVFAVPGQIDNPKTRGPHWLIRQGAQLVESIDDILDELGPLPISVETAHAGQVQKPGALRLNQREKRIYSLLDSTPKGIDEVVNLSGLSIQEVSSTLMVLELKRMVCKLAGNRFVRKR